MIKKLYFWTQLLYYILYVASLFGIFFIAPKYFATLINIIKIYICIILMWKFNPFIKYPAPIGAHERELIFSSAVFLLLTTSIADMLIPHSEIPIELINIFK